MLFALPSSEKISAGAADVATVSVVKPVSSTNPSSRQTAVKISTENASSGTVSAEKATVEKVALVNDTMKKVTKEKDIAGKTETQITVNQQTYMVSGRNMPDISFTGDMSVDRNTVEEQETSNLSDHLLSEEDMGKVRSVWPALQKHLDDSGKIRLLAALSHSRFEGGNIVVTVANKAIEQEVLDARADIQEFIFGLAKVRVIVVVEVTADEVFVNKPVSDSQRLQAMIEKHPEIRVLCEKLSLKL